VDYALHAETNQAGHQSVLNMPLVPLNTKLNKKSLASFPPRRCRFTAVEHDARPLLFNGCFVVNGLVYVLCLVHC
jgi:hypothetical protein